MLWSSNLWPPSLPQRGSGSVATAERAAQRPDEISNSSRVGLGSVTVLEARAWAQGELDSFLIEISALILAKKDEDGTSYIVDKILDKTGMKGTGAPPGRSSPPVA